MMWFGIAFGVSLLCGPILLRIVSIPFTLVDLTLTGLADWLQGGDFSWQFHVRQSIERGLSKIAPNDRRVAATVVGTKDQRDER